MNSFAEEKILGTIFNELGYSIEFWNQPSRLRPNGDPVVLKDEFSEAAESVERKFLLQAKAKGPVHLLAHSFGAHFALILARRHPDLLASVSLICPGFGVYEALKKIVGLALMDFNKSDPLRAGLLKECLEKTVRMGDEPLFRGLACAMEDVLLFSHYWNRQECLARYAAVLSSSPEASFDLESFYGTLRTMDFDHMDGPAIGIPEARAFFGRLDPVIDERLETRLLKKVFPNIEVAFLEKCGHFPHLEEPEIFVRMAIGRTEMNRNYSGGVL